MRRVRSMWTRPCGAGLHPQTGQVGALQGRGPEAGPAGQPDPPGIGRSATATDERRATSATTVNGNPQTYTVVLIGGTARASPETLGTVAERHSGHTPGRCSSRGRTAARHMVSTGPDPACSRGLGVARAHSRAGSAPPPSPRVGSPTPAWPRVCLRLGRSPLSGDDRQGTDRGMGVRDLVDLESRRGHGPGRHRPALADGADGSRWGPRQPTINQSTPVSVSRTSMPAAARLSRIASLTA
jgi:hypothetical protein